MPRRTAALPLAALPLELRLLALAALLALASPALPAPKLRWARDLPPLRPTWPDQPKLDFGADYRPAHVPGPPATLVVPSPRDDTVAGYDLATGEIRWRFPAGGPVRLPPAVWDDRVYFTSDDGHLYCLDGRTGAPLWKFRGAPSARAVLGNERLISAWPARGGPALAEEGPGRATVYFAAGIWPFEGIFLYALDARTGAVRWSQSGDGSLYVKQPHNSDSFAGVAPQGSLAVAGDYLLVPGGRSVPACYDRHTGKLVHFLLNENSKKGGGWQAQAGGGIFLTGGVACDLKTGKYLGPVPGLALFDAGRLVRIDKGKADLLDLPNARTEVQKTKDRKGKETTKTIWTVPTLRTCAVPKFDVLALERAGGVSPRSLLYAASPGKVFALPWPLPEKEAGPVWDAEVEGTPTFLLPAGDHLVVSTREGRLYAFGPGDGEPRRHPLPEAKLPAETARAAEARRLLEGSGARAGYALVLGAGDGDLVAELVRQSDLHVIATEKDPEKVKSLRGRFLRDGVYGPRVHVLPEESVSLPPYLATLLVVNDSRLRPGTLRTAYRSVRPFGGVMALPDGNAPVKELTEGESPLPGARAREAGGWALLVREGPLPGSGDWTHEHADAANTRVARDRLVKAPLGLLWFGGPGNQSILPRHGHGPQPQVIDGRLIIEGMDVLRALDVYTGRLLWQADLPGVGKAFDNTAHRPGANASGSNYVSLADGIYVAYRDACLVLDPQTGRTRATFRQPPLPGEKEAPAWQYLNVVGDHLIGGANPAGTEVSAANPTAASRRLVALDRHTGRLLWRATAESGFRHNAICGHGDRLFAIDRPDPALVAWLKRRGRPAPASSRLVALDLQSGKQAWSTAEEVFGTWLSYSAEHDILVEAGRQARDTLKDEPKGMRAYRGKTGEVLWFDADFRGPAMIQGDRILKQDSACELLTGKPVLREDPLTGEKVEWVWSRNYGCNTPMASEHLLTFRSGAAGYFDLCRDGGTGNFGGFRSGCTNNLVVAAGVLCAPDYTRTCTCSYQNQTSLALVPLPEAEMWTFFGKGAGEGPIRRLGLNLGAPGDRRDESGTLWLEYPSAGGPSPAVDVEASPDSVSWFRRHASLAEGDGLKWVASSGARGLTELRIDLRIPEGGSAKYTVRLHFLEPDGLAPGKRRFDVSLQGKKALAGLDVSREAGGPGRPLVKEFKGVAVDHRGLTIALAPAAAIGARSASEATDRARSASEATNAPVLSGVEVIAEDGKR